MLKKIIIYIIVSILMLFIINEAYTKLYKLSNGQNELEKIIKVGNLPALDTSDDIIGIDKNYNGIRDDIDKYILSLSLTKLQVKRLQELAKYLQMTIIIEPSKRKVPNEFAKEKALAQFCAINAFTDKKLARQYIKNLQAYTANTYELLRPEGRSFLANCHTTAAQSGELRFIHSLEQLTQHCSNFMTFHHHGD